MKVEVRLENSGTSWGASARGKELGGVVAAVADTREAAIEEFRTALRFHLDGLRETGKRVPTISGLVIREVLAA